MEEWLSKTDESAPSPIRGTGRNNDWRHLKNQGHHHDARQMEYPGMRLDLAFQCISMAVVDPTFATPAFLVMRRVVYEADGQLPRLRMEFQRMSTPVHAWAAMQVTISKRIKPVRILFS